MGLGGRRRRADPVWKADFTTGAALVFGVRGEGRPGPGVRRACDDAFAILLAGRVESLNVSVAAGIASSRPRDSAVAETLYLFDGYNLLHAGGFAEPQALVDRLAGFVAVRGARGIVVFDGEGADATYGALAVRYAKTADHLLERLAAEHRGQREVILALPDRAIRDTAGLDVRKIFSQDFAPGFGPARTSLQAAGKAEDALEDETRRRLEEWRRGRP